MSEPILKVDQLTVNVEDKEILHGINLTVNKGETHVLMGPNGAGKSTLGYVLMGNPRYQVSGGSINFKGNDVTNEGADKRAKEGMFLSRSLLKFRVFLWKASSEMQFVSNRAESSSCGHSRRNWRRIWAFFRWTTHMQKEA